MPRQPREVASPASPVLPASSRGGAIWTVLAAAGLAALLATAEHALTVIRYAGALYLLYLAWKTLRHLDAPLESRGARSSWRAFRRGLVTNLLNPKIGLFFLAFLPQFTNAELSPVWLQMLVLGGIFFSIGTGVLIIVALAAGQAQAWLAGSRTARRALNGLSATAFGGLGLRLILVDDAVYKRAMSHADPRLIVALDLPTTDAAWSLVESIGDTANFYKIGLQLFPMGGMELCRKIKATGKQVFLDFKLHDIPATVEKATRSITTGGADLLTIHAEPAVMRAAVAGREGSDLKLLGVTVMTCYDDAMLAEMGYAYGARDLVLRRVEQSLEAGVDGIVASAHEAKEIRERFGDDLLIVTPGIRPAGADVGDQKRVATPASALADGASHLVVGRPINAAPDPAAAAAAIVSEIASV